MTALDGPEHTDDAAAAGLAAAPQQSAPPIKSRRFQSRTLRRMFRTKIALIAGVFVAILVLVALLGPWISPHDPAEQDLFASLEGPSGEHWLGTDSLGRDNLSRLIQGTRLTLLACVQAVVLAIALGVPTGLAAGFIGRTLDTILSWIADTLLALPPLILALAITGILGPGLTNAMIAVGIVFSPRFYRVARAAALSVRNETYIEAARSLGMSTPRILFQHVLPNSSGPLMIQVTFSLGLVVVAEASLSFLGLGVRPPEATWGAMLQDSFSNIYSSTFGMIAPAVMIVLTILASSILGDALRDALGRQTRVGD
jgi:peptide/nickel transport system permease protein